MDNSNNPNQPNNPSPINIGPTPPTPDPNPPTWPPPPPANPIPPPASPWTPPQPEPVYQPPTPTTTPQSFETNPFFPQQIPSNPTNPIPEPSQPNIPSSLDNPWGGPPQPPPLDGHQQAQPTPLENPWGTTTQPPTLGELSHTETKPEVVQPSPTPPEPAVSSQPDWMASTATIKEDSTPTDLSQLIASSPQPESNIQITPETVVATQPNVISPDVPTLPTEGHKGIPKWLIGVGIGLLLIVLGASAYFILGVGQQKTTTSIPAVTEETTVKTPPPATSPVPQATPSTATDSASFDQLGGSGNTAPQASSAADILKQRQQQGR